MVKLLIDLTKIIERGGFWKFKAAWRLLCLLLLLLAASPAQGKINTVVIYDQEIDPQGGFYLSSWWSPDESPYDEYRWDDFTLENDQQIEQIQWVGGYDPAKAGGTNEVIDFRLAIYGSTAMDSQPDVTNPPLVEYQTGGSAGESPAGTINGLTVYDYQFNLPLPFEAQGGTKYWLYVVAEQDGRPNWSFSKGLNGDGVHFRNLHEGNLFQIRPGDFAFTLLGPAPPISGLNASNDGPTELGKPTTFTATVSSGLNVNFSWDFGDGSFGSGPMVEHFYAAAGQYTATVTASNSEESVQATTDVQVFEPPEPSFENYMPVVLWTDGDQP